MTASSAAVEEVLSHFGVKGMKWGKRKIREAQDKSFERNSNSMNTYIKLHNASADHFNSKIGALNKKYDGVDLLDPNNGSKKAQYDYEAETLMKEAYTVASRTITNKSGTRSLDVAWDRNGNLYMGTKEIEQAGLTSRAKYEVTRNANGLITKVKFMPDAITQMADAGSSFISHYGVKGMRWGKTTKSAPAATPVRVTQKGKKLKTAGGQGVKPHADAVNAAKAKQKAKASGLQALSNKDLQELQTRLNLERNVRQLTVYDKQVQRNRASRFVRGLLKNSGEQEAQKVSNSAMAAGVGKLLGKK